MPPSPPGKAEAPAAAAPAAPAGSSKVPMISSAGYGVVVVLMVLEAAIVYWAATALKAPEAHKANISRPFTTVFAGPFSRDLPSGDGTFREVFKVEINLQLNGHYENLDELKSMVEGRMTLLQHVIGVEIIQRKPEPELRKPNVLDLLAQEIKQRVNQELGVTKDGQEIIERVLFKDPKVPFRH